MTKLNALLVLKFCSSSLSLGAKFLNRSVQNSSTKYRFNLESEFRNISSRDIAMIVRAAIP